jgi:carboxypeptidase T
MKPSFPVVTSLCLAVVLISPFAAAVNVSQNASPGTSLPSSADIYYSYESMTSLLQGLAANHSDIMSIASTGTTYQGRTIWSAKISDNVGTEEASEPQVLFMGAHHGNEKPGAEVCIRFIKTIVDSYQTNATIHSLVDSTEIFVIPMVNPDGYATDTRKNQEPNHGPFGHRLRETSIGVDVNRNYGYEWNRYFFHLHLYRGATKIRDSSPEYRGPSPFSTAETQAVRSFVNSHTIKIAISYHTFGQDILYPWGDHRYPPKDVFTFLSIGENISNIDGYTLEQSIQLYPTLGDACDWMYGAKGIYAFTIELGTEYAPDSPAVLNSICTTHFEVNIQMLRMALTL